MREYSSRQLCILQLITVISRLNSTSLFGAKENFTSSLYFGSKRFFLKKTLDRKSGNPDVAIFELIDDIFGDDSILLARSERTRIPAGRVLRLIDLLSNIRSPGALFQSECKGAFGSMKLTINC